MICRYQPQSCPLQPLGTQGASTITRPRTWLQQATSTCDWHTQSSDDISCIIHPFWILITPHHADDLSQPSATYSFIHQIGA